MNNHNNVNKYQIDNIDAYLIKNIINQVFKNVDSLAEYHKITLRERYNFKFFKNKTKFTVSKDSNLISNFNIGQFLGGIAPDTVKRWRAELDNKDFTLSPEQSHKKENLFRRIRSSTLILFNGKGKDIQNGRKIIEFAIDAYMKENFAEPDYMTKIYFLLDECALWNSERGEGSHSEASFERLISRSDYSNGHGYLQ